MKLTTNQVSNVLGAGTNEAQAFVRQWNQMALGLRASLQIEVSREASYFDGTVLQSVFSKDQTVIRAILRAAGSRSTQPPSARLLASLPANAVAAAA